MKRKKKRYIFLVQVIALGMVSLSILCMPFQNILSNSSRDIIVSYLIATVFWMGIALFLACSIWEAGKNRKGAKGRRKRQMPGILRFCSTRAAAWADVIMTASLLGFIAVCIWAKEQQITAFVLLAIFVFAFGMHCILNSVSFDIGRKGGEEHD